MTKLFTCTWNHDRRQTHMISKVVESRDWLVNIKIIAIDSTESTISKAHLANQTSFVDIRCLMAIHFSRIIKLTR